MRITDINESSEFDEPNGDISVLRKYEILAHAVVAINWRIQAQMRKLSRLAPRLGLTEPHEIDIEEEFESVIDTNIRHRIHAARMVYTVGHLLIEVAMQPDAINELKREPATIHDVDWMYLLTASMYRATWSCDAKFPQPHVISQAGEQLFTEEAAKLHSMSESMIQSISALHSLALEAAKQ